MKSSSSNANHWWSLLTTHGRVLAYVAADPEARLRDIAAGLAITERTAVQIVNDLERAGYLARTRVGRRNRYQLAREREVRMPRLPTLTIGELLAMVVAFEQPFA